MNGWWLAMRWFGGSTPGRPVPAGSRLLWQDPPLWTAGDRPLRHVRTAESNGRRLAVFGPCAASSRDLDRALYEPGPVRAGRMWAGAYAVVRQGESGDVEIFTDPASALPLYTTRFQGGTVWGSSSRALAALSGGEIDTAWMAAFLLDRQSPAPQRSAWAGVAPVPAGARLVLQANGSASATPWWSPPHRSYGEAVPWVAEALHESVRARVEGVQVSSDVAGIDSTTVAVLAAQHGQVLGLTAHPEGVTDGGDLTYARQVPGLELTEFPLRRTHLPFTPADLELPATDEPAPSSGLWAAFSGQLLSVADQGSVCHLTGDGGDNLFMAPPVHLADLARTGRWLRMGRDALAWSQLRRESPWPLVGAALSGSVARLHRPWMTRPEWLTVQAGEVAVSPDDSNAALVANLRGAARGAAADAQLADALGVELANPYFDGALLDAVVSVPPEDRFSVRRYKPLLVDAVGSHLPAAHRTRTAKGVFAGDFHRGVRANLTHLLASTDGHLAAAGLIDPGPLRSALHSVALGARSVWPPLLAALVAEMWMAAIESAAPVGWVPVAEGAR
ncbi:albusnodin/ikarugamycin family macrolactam cyclase [Streptomyces sp. NPDC008265]|uniref:albusnodin/ikarugamycin family macrolactam cyclase n=1 Tax=Streptomyces sp. NPDC008265 TaxID=3364824 RepID=UPI0036E9DE27